jgi:hypothetical protein
LSAAQSPTAYRVSPTAYRVSPTATLAPTLAATLSPTATTEPTLTATLRPAPTTEPTLTATLAATLDLPTATLTRTATPLVTDTPAPVLAANLQPLKDIATLRSADLLLRTTTLHDLLREIMAGNIDQAGPHNRLNDLNNWTLAKS